MSHHEAAEKRFAHLLQPIRDLAQNWSIDVAKDLEEYLEELDHIQISFDGGKTSLNFAEAAMLIQGSAAIWSRKVEYLYALIFQTLDLIHAQRRKGKKDPSKVTDADAEELLRVEAEDEFLLLDAEGMIPKGKNIDLKERREEVELQAALTYGLSSAANNNNGTMLHSRTTVAAATSVAAALQPMLNLSILSYGGNPNMTNNNNSNISTMHLGDMTGLPGLHITVPLATPAARRAQQALLSRTPLSMLGGLSMGAGGRTLGGGGFFGQGMMGGGRGGNDGRSLGIGGGFRLTNAIVSKSGALVLDTGAANAQRAALEMTLPATSLHSQGVSRGSNAVGGRVNSIAPSAATTAGAAVTTTTNTVAHRASDLIDISGDYDENGWFLGADEDDTDEKDENATAGSGNNSNNNNQGLAAQRQRRQTRAPDVFVPGGDSNNKFGGGNMPPKRTLDPWTTLDPNQDAGAATHRPFRPSRTWMKLHAPERVASKGPEAVAAEMAAMRAQGAAAASSANGSGGNMRLAKQLLTQAKVLAQRAAAIRAAGPLSLQANIASTTASSFRGGFGQMSKTSSSSSSSFVVSPASTMMTASAAFSFLSSSVNPATTNSMTVNGSGSTSNANATASSATTSASAAGYIICPEMEGLLRRAHAAGIRARRVHRRAIATAFPTSVAAAGGAYDDAEFFGSAANDDYDDFVVVAPAPRGVQKREGDTDEGDDNADGFGEIVSENMRGADGEKIPAGSRFDTALDAPEDAMAYLHDAVGGDEAYEEGRRALRFAVASDDTSSGRSGTAGYSAMLLDQETEDDAFHSLVQAHISAFTANAGAILHSTRMQRRIEAWQNRMEPLLAEEDARPEFDIIAYGGKLLDVMATQTSSAIATKDAPATASKKGAKNASKEVESSTLDFVQVIGAVAPSSYEVCRNFLALLQLANNGNIDIEAPMVPQQQPSSAAPAAATKGSKKTSKKTAPESDEAWMFSQAVVYGQDSELEVQTTTTNGKTEASRVARLSTEFPQDGHIAVIPSFKIHVLNTIPKYDIDAYVAPSQMMDGSSMTTTSSTMEPFGTKNKNTKKGGGGAVEDFTILPPGAGAGLGMISAGITAGDSDDEESFVEAIASSKTAAGKKSSTAEVQARMRALLSPGPDQTENNNNKGGKRDRAVSSIDSSSSSSMVTTSNAATTSSSDVAKSPASKRAATKQVGEEGKMEVGIVATAAASAATSKKQNKKTTTTSTAQNNDDDDDDDENDGGASATTSRKSRVTANASKKATSSKVTDTASKEDDGGGGGNGRKKPNINNNNKLSPGSKNWHGKVKLAEIDHNAVNTLTAVKGTHQIASSVHNRSAFDAANFA